MPQSRLSLVVIQQMEDNREFYDLVEGLERLENISRRVEKNEAVYDSDLKTLERIGGDMKEFMGKLKLMIERSEELKVKIEAQKRMNQSDSYKQLRDMIRAFQDLGDRVYGNAWYGEAGQIRDYKDVLEHFDYKRNYFYVSGDSDHLPVMFDVRSLYFWFLHPDAYPLVVGHIYALDSSDYDNFFERGIKSTE